MTKVSALKSQIDKKANTLHHASALIAALKNPSEWEYTGECLDAGVNSSESCACGHPIRYCFVIKHPIYGINQVGSTCIEHFKAINPALYESLQNADQALRDQLAEARRQAKAVQNADKIKVAKAAYLEVWLEARAIQQMLKDRIIPVRPYSPEGKLFIPFWRLQAEYPAESPEYARAHSYIKWYTEKAAALKMLVARVMPTLNAEPVSRYAVKWGDETFKGNNLFDLLITMQKKIAYIPLLPINFWEWRTDTARVRWLIEQGHITPMIGEQWFMSLAK